MSVCVVARVMRKVCASKGVSMPLTYKGNHNIPSTEPVKHASNSACSTSEREARCQQDTYEEMRAGRKRFHEQAVETLRKA
jgi:hypothetical protein